VKRAILALIALKITSTDKDALSNHYLPNAVFALFLFRELILPDFGHRVISGRWFFQ